MQRTLRQLFVGVVTILVTLLLLGCPSPTGDDGGGSSGGNGTSASDAIALTMGSWRTATIGLDTQMWFSAAVSAGSTYKISWDDLDAYGDYDVDLVFDAYQADGTTAYFTEADSFGDGSNDDGTIYKEVTIASGENTIFIVADSEYYAEDEEQGDFRVKIELVSAGDDTGGDDTTASTDATLSNLAISEGTLSSAFAAATTSYTVSVENAVTSMTVTPTVNDSNATVTVNGTTVASGSASGAISLDEGSNTITVVVTAEDGTTTESYTITVTRAAAGAAWTSIDLGVSGTIMANNGLVVDSSGSIYAMYRDASDDVQVVKRSGSSNAVITPSGLVNGSNGLIALDPTDNEPVIMTMTESGISLPVVRKYGGSGTTWSEVASAGLQGLFTDEGTSFEGSSTYSDMAVDSAGNIYVVLQTWSLSSTYDDKALVAKYDGTNWTRIGLLPDIASTSSDADAYVAISVDSSDNVYVGFSRDMTGETHLSAVYTYNSTDETWSLVGDSTVTANYTYDFDFTIAGDSVWVAAEYQPGGTGDYSLYAYNYDGSVWTQSGSPLATSPSEVVIVPNGNHPLAVAKTGLSSENRVDFDTFDGSSWSEAAPAIEDYYIQNTRVTVVNGVIYVSYQRKAGSASDWEFRASSYQIPD